MQHLMIITDTDPIKQPTWGENSLAMELHVGECVGLQLIELKFPSFKHPAIQYTV